MPATTSQDQINADSVSSDTSNVKSDEVVSEAKSTQSSKPQKSSKSSKQQKQDHDETNCQDEKTKQEKKDTDTEQDSVSKTQNKNTQDSTKTDKSVNTENKTFVDRMLSVVYVAVDFVKKVFARLVRLVDFILVMLQHRRIKKTDSTQVSSVNAESIVGSSATYVVVADSVHSKLVGRPCEQYLRFSSVDFAKYVSQAYIDTLAKMNFSGSNADAKKSLFVDIKIKSDDEDAQDDLVSKLSKVLYDAVEVMQNVESLDLAAKLISPSPVSSDDAAVTHSMLDSIYENVYSGALSAVGSTECDLDSLNIGYLANFQKLALDFVGDDLFNLLTAYHSWPVVVASGLAASLTNLVDTNDKDVKVSKEDIAKVASMVALNVYMLVIRPDQTAVVTRWLKTK